MPPKPAWYCPQITSVAPEAPKCGFGTTMVDGVAPSGLRLKVHCTIVGRRIEVHLATAVMRVAFVGLIFLGLWAALPKPLMHPGNYVFDPLTAWFVTSLIGGSVCHFFRLPALVGILWAAVIWGNIPSHGELTEGIVPQLRFITSRLGLTVIVSRAGFAVHLGEVKKKWKSVFALSLLPLVLEAVVHALIAQAVFKYPDYRWAFLQGFVVSGIAPGVVVPPLLGLLEEGYGHTGPTSIMLSAVVFDSVLAIWATTFFADLIFSDLSVGLAIALGPIQLIGGLLIGCIVGLLLHLIVKTFLLEVPATRVDLDIENPISHPGQSHLPYRLVFPEEHVGQVHYKVVALYSAMAAAFVFIGERVNLAGGGAIGVLGLAATVAHLWAPPPPPPTPVNPDPRTPSVDSEVPSDEEMEERFQCINGNRATSPTSSVCSSNNGHDGVGAEPFETTSAVDHEDNEILVKNGSMASKPRRDTPIDIPVNGHISNGDATKERKDNAEVDAEAKSIGVKAHRDALAVFFGRQRQTLFMEYAWIWDNLVMPALFSMAGTAVVLTNLFDSDFFPKAIGVLVAGVAARFIFAMFSGLGQGFTAKELVFIGMGWIGKAAVQAALGGIAKEKAAKQDPVDLEALAAADYVQRMAMLGAVLFAPISAVCVILFGRMWLPLKGAV